MIKGKDKNCWYWYTDPREGDVWYPCYYMDNGQVMVDGSKKDASMFDGLTIIKAVMPD